MNIPNFTADKKHMYFCYIAIKMNFVRHFYSSRLFKSILWLVDI